MPRERKRERERKVFFSFSAVAEGLTSDGTAPQPVLSMLLDPGLAHFGPETTANFLEESLLPSKKIGTMNKSLLNG